ncbi:hypothetical protein [Aquabacterium humicola]|uniref:hypothetical protein n=1 Tax=Aquabacterium humicola TaxID=3237377 RepID=UPI0025433C23|nr:hypothetical protein [Rubrivivax pictus]
MTLSAAQPVTVAPAVTAHPLSVLDPAVPGIIAPPKKPPSRTVARVSPRPSIVRPPPAVRADITVQYAGAPEEQRMVELRFWGDQQQLMAHSRGPSELDCETRLLPLTHDGKRSPTVTALRGLAALYFGPTGLLPRIIGEPDWTSATMSLQSDPDGEGHQMLLQVQLRIDGHNGLRANVRHSMPGAAQQGPVSLVIRPGDADPLHALLRVGFGTAPWQMPA